MTRPVIVKLSCEATPSTDTQDIDRAEWDAMTPAQRAAMLDNMVSEHIGNAGGGGWSIADPDDEAAVGLPPGQVVLPLADNPAVVSVVRAWLADPRSPRGPVYESARALLTRIDAAISGGGA